MSSDTGRDFPDLRVIDGSVFPGVRFVVTTREGGVSVGEFAHGNLADHVGDSPAAVRTNRSVLAKSMGADRGLAVIAAVHGAATRVVRQAGTYQDVDALVTDEAGLGLLALGADCAVVGLAGTCSDGSIVAGVAHCGWRGLVVDVLASVVRELEVLGGHGLRAVVGPAICGTCYRVDESRMAQVREECTAGVIAAAVGPEVARGVFELDIRAGVQRRLWELGVEVVSEFGCTAEDERWFSHRGATEQRGAQARTGRHGLGIIISADSNPGFQEGRT